MNDYEAILLRYISALDRNDIDTLIEIWDLTDDQPQLVQDLLDINQELGDQTMFLNSALPTRGITKVPTVPTRTTKVDNIHKPASRWTYQRVAVLLLLISSLLIMISQSNPEPELAQTVFLDQTATELAQPNVTGELAPVGRDNIDQLVELGRSGQGMIRGAQWSPDGAQLVVYGTYVWVYDADDLTTPTQIIDANLYADYAAFGLTSDSLVVANDSGEAALINLTDETIVALPKLANTIAFARYGDWVARFEFGDNTRITVWDIVREREIFVFYDFNEWVDQLAFTPDGQYLAAAGKSYPMSFSTQGGSLPVSNYQVKFWDMAMGQEAAVLDIDDETTGVTELIFSPDGQFANAVTFGLDLKIYQWDMNVKNYQPDVVVTGWDYQWLAYSADALYSIGGFGSLMALDPATLDMTQAYDFSLSKYVHPAMYTTSLDINPVNQNILVTTHVSVHVLDAQSGEQIGFLNDFNLGYNGTDTSENHVVFYNRGEIIVQDLVEHETVARWEDENRGITGAVFLNDDTLLVYGKPNSYSVAGLTTWDYAADEWQAFETDDMNQVSGSVAIEVSPTADQISYLVPSGYLFVQDLATNTIAKYAIANKSLAEELNLAVATNPLAPNVFAVGTQRLVQIVDTASASVSALPGHSDQLCDVAFGADGQRLYSVDMSGNLIVWDTATWEEVAYQQIETDYATQMAVVADNSLLVVSHGAYLQFFDTETLELVSEMKAHADTITAVDVSTDGSQLITTSNDGTVRYWGITLSE